jgi:flagellar biosynthesis protein FlhG
MMNEQKQPLILSIGGGKGGVGKSMISSNLGIQYAQAGFKTILIDLDMGAANLHTIFGIRQPPKGLGDYFSTPRSSLNDYILETAVPNLYLIPGSGFVPELANLKHALKTKIINQMKTLDADLILLDLGAGSAVNVIDFFSMTHAGIIVTTPEPTAIVNAYEFMKNVIFRIFFRMFRSQEHILEAIKRSAISNGTQGKTVSEIIEEVRKICPFSAENMHNICNDLNFYVVFNQARSPEDVGLGRKLNQISQKYLGLTLNFSGLVFHNEEVSTSVLRMSPVSLAYPKSITTKTIRGLACSILKHLTDTEKGVCVPSEDLFSLALQRAKSDYIENHLTQKRLQKETASVL